ncbi:zinc finger protein 585A isoform X1 [Anopheles gambiae]|uniref:zinc finger protein 585A isoform X1 n=2 Tax=Anopheles gambiae TaxID=7165 RepID=UPI002AC9707F|nr:zinc finger protein 585A isoform X1 [Anopheles gambiae]
MQQRHRTIRCNCCNETADRLIEFESEVLLLEREVKIREMIGIFQLPQESLLRKTNGICTTCLERLENCFLFYETLITTITMKEHSITASPKKDNIPTIRCTDCDSAFESMQDLEKHAKVQHCPTKQHQQQFHYCSACQKSFKTNRGLLQHNAIYHESQELHRCYICERQFLTKTNLQNHMRFHKDHVCSFCNSGWTDECQLLEHVRTTHRDGLFVCRFCNKQERLKKCLNRHLRTAHGQEVNPYYCGHCRNAEATHSYDSYVALMNHLQEQHTAEDDTTTAAKELHGTLLNASLFGKELELLEDDKVVDVEQDRFLQNLHLVRSVPERPKTCQPLEPRIDQRTVLEDFLDETFENDEIWNKYIDNGEEYLIDDYDIYLKGMDESEKQEEVCMYLCPQCKQGFQSQRNLTIHLAEEHDVSSLVCNDCGASFTRHASYRIHRREHLKENVRFRESNIPEMEEALSLVQSTSLDYSVHEEESGYVFTCNLCDRTFQRKHNLEKHRCLYYEQLEHSNTSEQQGAGVNGTELQQCSHCQFRTTSSQELETHQQRIHQSDMEPSEPVYCMLCDRRFSSISGLKYHLKRHTGIKAFACLYCEKTFTANSNLNAHIRSVHSARKDYRCDECNESFTTKDHLNKHQRSRHRQERAFVCGECGKNYLQRSHLNEHVAASHREDRYLCHVCNGSYVSKSSLKRHQQQKHGVMKRDEK